jgi:hypothetical protein
VTRLPLAVAAALAVTAAPLGAQPRPQSADTGLTFALAAFDAADVGAGVAALRATLAALPESARAIRARAGMYLAAAQWWLGQADSADATMREAVATDPFVRLDAARLNPDVTAALLRARREVTVLGVRAPAEDTVRPDSGAWTVRVAVGRPGIVRVRYQGAGLDTVLASVAVDSSETLPVPLGNTGGVVVQPGLGVVHVQLMEGASQLAARRIDIAVERLRVDTTRMAPEPSPEQYRVETRRGVVSAPQLLRGLALAAAAAALPMVVANSALPGSTVSRGAMVLGGTLALGSVVGALAGRPVLPIEDNIQYNRLLRDTWQSRNRGIAADNEYRRRFAPLRVRATVAPS